MRWVGAGWVCSIRCGHLYRLLRPELVKQNPVPLSSDAFSRWGLHRAAQHNKEVPIAHAHAHAHAPPHTHHRTRTTARACER
jgi:hypothetical protein